MRTFAALWLWVSVTGAAHANGRYVIDPTHTFPTFEISHLGFSTFRGRFDRTEGIITYDPEQRTGSAEVTIDVASVSTGVQKLDNHLLNEDFFDAAKYPNITFKSSQFRFEGDRLVEVEGDLTMHGVTRPVTLQVSSLSCKPHPLKAVWACGADVTATLRRSDWGISKYSPNIGENVTVKIEVEAHQQGGKSSQRP